MIAPLSEADVDVFVVLDPAYYDASGQASLLDRVKRALRRTYPKTPDISRNGQAVTIRFTDFRVDVVPAFYRTGGGFLIPDSIGRSWISTDPKRHVEIVTNANKAHNGDLVPLIKMLKGWNKAHSSLFRSFHLEVLILSVLENITISDFPSGVRYAFDKARAKLNLALADPAGYDGDVGSYLNTREKIDDLAARLQRAFERARDAEQLEGAGRTTEAYAKWKLVFGDYFPTYG
jgi:hypothetical protein